MEGGSFLAKPEDNKPLPEDKKSLPEVTIRKETTGNISNPSTNDLSDVSVEKVSEYRVRKPSASPMEIFLEWLYDFLYFLGVYTQRKLFLIKRKIKSFFVRLPGTLFYMITLLRRGVHSIGKGIKKWAYKYIRRINSVLDYVQPDIDRARAKGKISWVSYRRVIWECLCIFGRIIASIFNYLIPIASAIVLIMVVNYYQNRSMGLQVIYRGTEIGIVKEEKDFTEALRGVSSRIISDTDTIDFNEQPVFELIPVQGEGDYTSQETLEDGIIQASSDNIEQAYGVFVDNQLVGAVTESEPITKAIQAIRYADATGNPDEEFGFNKPVRISQKGLYPLESITTEEEILQTLNSTHMETLQYTVREGDTLETIVANIGVSEEEFLALNPAMVGVEEFETGTVLQYQAEVPFLSVTHSYTVVYDREKPYEIVETSNVLYNKNYRFITSPGVPGIEQVTARVTTLNGEEINRTILSTENISDPIAEQVVIGVDTPEIQIYGGGTSSGGFIWPTPNGGYISCDLWGYYNHSGIDIAGTGGIGTPVIASRAGTVTRAFNSGYNGGYGNYVMIDHGEGYETLYAHNSQVVVSVGDYVEQGQLIAYVGMTGNTSGPHIHFEVLENGVVRDPKIYVGAG